MYQECLTHNTKNCYQPRRCRHVNKLPTSHTHSHTPHGCCHVTIATIHGHSCQPRHGHNGQAYANGHWYVTSPRLLLAILATLIDAAIFICHFAYCLHHFFRWYFHAIYWQFRYFLSIFRFHIFSDYIMLYCRHWLALFTDIFTRYFFQISLMLMMHWGLILRYIITLYCHYWCWLPYIDAADIIFRHYFLPLLMIFIDSFSLI